MNVLVNFEVSTGKHVHAYRNNNNVMCRNWPWGIGACSVHTCMVDQAVIIACKININPPIIISVISTATTCLCINQYSIIMGQPESLAEVGASQLAQASERGWLSNTSFTTGLKTLPTFRPDALVKTCSGQNIGKAFNPVVKLVLENQPLSGSLAV